jgi:outer membrane protein
MGMLRLVAATGWLCTAAAPAAATTLAEALAATYANNPTLTGQRAALRATDEQYGIVRASGLPQAAGTGSVTQGIDNYRAFNTYNRAISAGAAVNVPVYQGGRVKNALRAADARVAGGQQGLRSTEGNVFVQAVGAYMDVLRDRSIVELNQNNVRVLQTNLDATNDQFQAGSLTRTDVAQSVARLEGAKSQLAAARATLTGSEENYRQVVGQPAGVLDQPPPLPAFPSDADAAETVALDNNPDIAAAAQAVRAAHFDTEGARSNRLPSVAASAGQNYFNFADPASGLARLSGQYSSVGVTATLPLYQGGLAGAQVRQEQAFEQQAIENQTATERQVVANTHAAYSSYQASLYTTRSSEEQVKANTLALEGLRAEQGVGLRQVLDVLNGEQELLSSKVTLVSAQHDAYLAGFQLLNAMGVVSYKRLGLNGGPLYDPEIHYQRTRARISDFAEDPKPAPQARPVYGPAAPNEAIPLVTGPNK